MAVKHFGGAFWRLTIAAVLAASFVAAASAAEPETLFSFKADGKGEHPWASPVLGPDGALYGTTYLGGAGGVGTVYQLTPKPRGEWKRKVLHEFAGGDGSGPNGGVILAGSGKLYGTTESGGRGECSGGCGVVYELAPRPNGTYGFSVIHRFNKVASGVRSQGQLLEDEGILYGVTAAGGTSDMGTVFRLAPTTGGGWKHTILHSFSGGEADGKYPYAGVVLGADGALYGTTQVGGRQFGERGTVYRLAKGPGGAWNFSLIHAFSGGADGEQPLAPVTFGPGGALYGVTTMGGGGTCFGGCGTAFRIVQNASGGWTKKTIHSFTGGADGSAPRGGMTADANGAVWGMTPGGGGAAAAGVIYKLKRPKDGGVPWGETIEHSFVNSGGAGGIPFGALTLDPATGVFYGATRDGGSSSDGTVFRFAP